MSNPAPGSADDGDTLADRGEGALVEALTRRLPQGKGVLVPPGDDAAVVTVDGAATVVSTDVLVSGVHFRLDWSDAHDIGRRAAAATLADLVAMGAQPVALVVGLVAPADTEVAWALRLADGLRDEAALVKASIVGGDVSAGDQVMIAVSGVGSMGGREPVLRSGAQPGDQVALAGRVGWAAAGLAVLSRGFGTPRALVEAYRRPEVEYALGMKAAALGAHAMCDVSDGLLVDLGRIAAASDVVVDLDSESLQVPEPVAAVAAAYAVDPLTWMLGGGDDHALVAMFPAKKRLPKGFVRIGRVMDAKGSGDAEDTDEEAVEPVTVDGAPWSGATGHAHYR